MSLRPRHSTPGGGKWLLVFTFLALAVPIPLSSKAQWYGEGGCGYQCKGAWACDPENCWDQWCARAPYPEMNCKPTGGPFECYCCDNDGNCDQLVYINTCVAMPSCRPPSEEWGDGGLLSRSRVSLCEGGRL